MATKHFKSRSGSRISVSVPGGWVEFEPGESYETDDPTVIEILSDNPEVVKDKGDEGGKGKKRSSDR